jgi:hypothetical protein
MTQEGGSSEPIRGHCPDCGPQRLANIKASFSKRDEDSGVWVQTDYRILECRGCETVYIQKDIVFSESCEVETDADSGEEWQVYRHDITYWPAPAKHKRPDWLEILFFTDFDLSSLLASIYTALDNDLRVLAAIGIRTTFDRASELLGVDPAKAFAAKLQDLASVGKIGTAERHTLNVLTDAGSAAAHRGWKPSPEELETMINVIEVFLHRNFIVDPAVKRLRGSVPPRAKAV